MEKDFSIRQMFDVVSPRDQKTSSLFYKKIFLLESMPHFIMLCYQISNIRYTKYTDKNVSRLNLQLSLPNPLKPGPVSISRLSFPGMGIPMFKIRRSWYRLILNMGKPILVRRHLFIETAPGVKARYGGSNMKKINNGGRLLIFYMIEGIKKRKWIEKMEFCDSLESLTPLKSKMAAKLRWKTGWPGNATTHLLRMIAIRLKQF